MAEPHPEIQRLDLQHLISQALAGRLPTRPLIPSNFLMPPVIFSSERVLASVSRNSQESEGRTCAAFFPLTYRVLLQSPVQNSPCLMLGSNSPRHKAVVLLLLERTDVSADSEDSNG